MPIRLTTEEFKTKANAVHNNMYTYENTVYTTSHTKVKITCRQHGVFAMKPNNHLSGKQGCPHCSKDTPDSRTKTTEEFVTEAKAIHGDAFDYAKVVYKNALTPVVIKHNSCATVSLVIPINHLKAKTCKVCSVQKLIQTNKDKQVQAAKNFSKKLGTDYTVVGNYVTARTKIEVRHKCGGTFKTTPDNLLRTRGCPHCALHGFNLTKPAILYYLSINNGEAYKIGITNRTVNERFLVKELTSINILYLWDFPAASTAYQMEQSILKKYSNYKYTGDPLLSSGNTELFSRNILNLIIKDFNVNAKFANANFRPSS